MNCPNCDVALVMSDKMGIEIGYCPKCRGIWLGRGELDKIIECSLGTQDRPNHNPHNQMYDDHDYNHHGYDKHRRKGILDGLFD